MAELNEFSKADTLREFYNRNRGRVVLLFGRPFTGKSTFAVALCKLVERAGGDYIYYAIDTTIPAPEDFELEKVSSWIELRRKLNQVTEPPAIIVVDSITTLATEFYGDKLLSPRANLMLARFYDEVLRKLAQFRGRTTVLVIAHESVSFGNDGEPQPRPRINENALRNVDVIYRAVKDGGYKITKWAERKVVEKPEFVVEI